MKIQCACGAKYLIETTPEMLQNPVRFVCPNCGLDSSDYVNELIRQELGGQPPAEALPEPAPVAPAPESPKLRISHAGAAAAPAEAPVDSTSEEHCAKHPREIAVNHCVVCGKPMCAQCMKVFGYVCSPLCRARAETQNIEVPVFAGQAGVAEARYWRVAGAIGGVLAVVVIAALGFYTWYAWVGSVPHVAYSLRFDDRAYAGQSSFCGTNQMVFLHGGTLARCDIKSQKEIWSNDLITQQQIADAVAQASERRPTDRFGQRIPQDQIEAAAARRLEGMLHLRVSGQNIWVSTPEGLTHYDWDTGRVLQQIPAGGGEIIARDGEFLLLGEGANGQAVVTHINPASGETREETIGQPGQTTVATAPQTSGQATGGLPVTPGADSSGAMNPAKVAEQAQNLSTPARIALPALVANESEQERIAAEADDQDQTPASPKPAPKPTAPAQTAAGNFALVAGPNGYVGFAVRLLESHIVTTEAMKAPPKNSALDGNLSSASETAAINEQLNEMQRDRGGGTVQEDESLYQVSLRRPDSTGPADWTGQVTGPPALYPLKTVTVLAAGKTLMVFDTANKKLWETTLTYNVAGGAPGGQASPFGEGPCVERGDTLYVIDQAVLTAFDASNGNARWRLPSVGIVGLFFDDKGMMYVNTTTADPENIKYSRQIDISQKIEAILLKIDPQTGRTLWSVKPGGFISYLSGKYIYTVQSFDPGDQNVSAAGIELPAYLRIRRISPSDGRQLWDYEDDRAPLDVQFKDNQIGLVFKKEVQALKFVSF